jgi:hypothetical protein
MGLLRFEAMVKVLNAKFEVELLLYVNGHTTVRPG